MVPVEAVANAIRQGRNPSGLVNWHHYREVLRGAFDRLGKLRSAGGGLGARKINGAFAAKGRKVRFRQPIAKAGRHKLDTKPVKAKASKLEAGYQDKSKHMPDHCGTCWMFQSIWQCCAVEGVINPNGWCEYFETVFAKAYDPNEPRDERGRWTSGGDVVFREAGQHIGAEGMEALNQPGHLYRGMSEAEYKATVARGEGVRSNLSSSIPSAEGTNFSGDIRDAESYANYGRDDPRTTGRPNYLVEVAGGSNITLKPDSYFQATETVPQSQITRVWRMSANGDAIVGQPIPVPTAKRFAKASGDQFSFDSFSPEVQDAIRQSQDDLIQQLEQDARDAIETIIADGTINGTDVDDIASEIADMIGLTDRQAQAVLNYQRMLQDLDPQALARQLRNSDYDAALQDAIDSGEDLSDAAVEQMVSDYIENYIDYRAATIASTESTRAANLGLHDAYSQAIDRGALTDEAVTRVWQLGDNPCPICESIVDNNPDGVGINDSFDSIDGPQDDPPVHPNCECSVDYVTDLTQVPDDGEDTGDPGPGSFGVGGVDTPYMDEG